VVAYLLLTDDKVFACRSFDGLAAKLLWARERGYTEVKARFANGDVDRPLLPSERVKLVEAATSRLLS
jgi:hypothetical protein